MNTHPDDEDATRAAKHELRTRTLTARDQLRAAYRTACGERLVDYLDLFGDVAGKTVSGFWPIRSEIDPRPLMAALKQQGALLALPVVLDKVTIEFRAYQSDEELIDAGFGTYGPGPKAARFDPDIMLVPLSVFDMHGGRIGYGAGFYDRAIQRLIDKGRKPFTVGLAFALQEVPKVPQNDHDICLDRILTHEGVIVPEARPDPSTGELF